MQLSKKKSFEEVQKSITKDGKRYQVGIGKDDNGYFAYTHRARSKSYTTKKGIPHKDLKFIQSTG